MKTTIAILIAASLLCCGCTKSKPRKRTVDDVAPRSFAAIHIDSAKARADLYDKVADGVEDEKLKTINDVMEFMNPEIIKAGEKYTESCNVLRKNMLHDVDDELPDDAVETFRKIADDYRSLVKSPTNKKRK